MLESTLICSGAAFIAYAMLATYSLALELGGFILLGIATVWDYRLRRAATS